MPMNVKLHDRPCKYCGIPITITFENWPGKERKRYVCRDKASGELHRCPNKDKQYPNSTLKREGVN